MKRVRFARNVASYTSCEGNNDYGFQPAEAANEAANEAAADVAKFTELVEAPSVSVATFKYIGTGRDGKLCLYEDKEGHLIAVRTSRLA